MITIIKCKYGEGGDDLSSEGNDGMTQVKVTATSHGCQASVIGRRHPRGFTP